MKFGDLNLRFFINSSEENYIDRYSKVIVKAFNYFRQKYGATSFGNEYTVAVIDDESLDAYSAPGMVLLSSKSFRGGLSDDEIFREVAFQWWGFTVGLKSFDNAWLSHGLAQWSAFDLRESTLSQGAKINLLNDLQTEARKFYATASIQRAPANVDDQSVAYKSIVFYKGALVFQKLREKLGQEKFDRLLKTYLEQYRGRNASIKDFEELTNQIAGVDMRSFFADWIEGTTDPNFL